MLMSQVSLSSAAVPWQVGDKLTYVQTLETSSTVEQNKADGLVSSSSLSFEIESDYEITAIDKVNLEVTFDGLDSDGTVDNNTMSYNSTSFGMSLGYFSATYLQFEDNNTFYLRSFYYPSPVTILVDPDFSDIATQFDEQFNSSKLVDTFVDWDDLEYYEFTLGNLFANMTSWSINEATTFADVRTGTTAETTEYTMEFDLSGLLTTSYTEVVGAEIVTIYIVYDVATVSLNWKYDSDGILKSYSETEKYVYVKNDATVTNEYKSTTKQPGFSLDTNALPGFELYLSILGLIAVPIIYRRRN